jgi:hypothetical protein
MNKAFVAGIALTCSLLPVAAHATIYGQLGAYSGHATVASQGSCFAEYASGVVSQCTTGSPTPQWEQPLNVIATGSYNPVLYVDNDLGTMACATLTVDQDGTINGNTGWVSVTAGTSGTFQPGAETVTTGGYLYVTCQMESGSLTNAYWYGTNW